MSDKAQALPVFVGVITEVSGERGVIKHITHSRHGEPDGAIVRLDDRPVFVYVELGLRALICTCGAEPLRREHHHPQCDLMSNLSTYHREVIGWREIERDEFDQLTGVAALRSEFGWDLG